MEKKNKFIFGISLFSLILMLSLVSGAITFTTPSTTGETINGTIMFNVTTEIRNATYCNWSTTASPQFATASNQTPYNFNVSYDTSGITDVEDTTLTVNCSNSTDSEVGTLVINVDNTPPVCLQSLPVGEDTVDYMDAFGVYPIDSSTDTTDLTWAWVLYDSSGNSQATSTSQTPNFEGTDLDEIGTFILELKVTDEALKTTACTNQTIMVRGTDGEVIPTVVGEFIEERKTEIIVGASVVALMVVLGGAFLVIKARKK